MAEDDAYYRFEDRDRGGPSHFPILQPQLRQPVRPVPTRDRFRSTQYGGRGYDDVEDDGVSEGMRLDSFGE
jgi:hypothetical protein